uniref:Uncharacterized protein n=2 Tax=Amphimedon queenslandica TaxID=400682 RepID=A0A1X7VH29_AMPQE
MNSNATTTSKRSKQGKGRKERLKHKLELLKAEREDIRLESLRLARRNTALKRTLQMPIVPKGLKFSGTLSNTSQHMVGRLRTRPSVTRCEVTPLSALNNIHRFHGEEIFIDKATTPFLSPDPWRCDKFTLSFGDLVSSHKTGSSCTHLPNFEELPHSFTDDRDFEINDNSGSSEGVVSNDGSCMDEAHDDVFENEKDVQCDAECCGKSEEEKACSNEESFMNNDVTEVNNEDIDNDNDVVFADDIEDEDGGMDNEAENEDIMTQDLTINDNDSFLINDCSEWSGFKIVKDNTDVNFRRTFQRIDDCTMSHHFLCCKGQSGSRQPV